MFRTGKQTKQRMNISVTWALSTRDKQRDDNPGVLDLSPGIFDFGGTSDNPAMV